MAEFEQRKNKETLYETQRKRSEHRLRRKQQHNEGLTSYEASEKERERGEEPKEKLLLENEHGRVAAGTSKDGRDLVIAAKRKEGVLMRDEERLKKDGAKALKGNGPKVFTSAAHEQKSAVAVENRQEKQKRQLVKMMSETAERMPQGQINELLPFLQQKEDKKDIRVLEDRARAERGDTRLKRESREEASKLRLDLMYKEEEKRRLLKDLEQIQTKQGREPEKKKGIVFPAAMLLAAVLDAAADRDDEAGEPQDEESALRDEAGILQNETEKPRDETGMPQNETDKTQDETGIPQDEVDNPQDDSLQQWINKF